MMTESSLLVLGLILKAWDANPSTCRELKFMGIGSYSIIEEVR